MARTTAIVERTELEDYVFTNGQYGALTPEETEIYQAILDYKDLRGLYSFSDVLEIRKEGGDRLETMNTAKIMARMMINKSDVHSITINTPDPSSFMGRQSQTMIERGARRTSGKIA